MKLDDHGQSDDQVDGVLSAELNGLAGDDALQFACGDQRAGGGERAEHDFKAECAASDGGHFIGMDNEFADADQGRRQSAECVGERGSLGHGGHGNARWPSTRR